MSKNRNQNTLFVDTGFLRDHVSRLREQKKLASRLYENVAAMKRVDDPTVAYKYDPVLRDISKLIDYFGRMADFLSNVDDDAVQLNDKLEALLRDSTEDTKGAINNTFML